MIEDYTIDLVFRWVLKIFWDGYKRELEIEDLSQPLKEHKSSLLGDSLAAAWDKEVQLYDTNTKQKNEPGKSESNVKVKHKKSKTPSLQRALTKVFGTRIALYGVALAIQELVIRYDIH